MSANSSWTLARNYSIDGGEGSVTGLLLSLTQTKTVICDCDILREEPAGYWCKYTHTKPLSAIPRALCRFFYPYTTSHEKKTELVKCPTPGGPVAYQIPTKPYFLPDPGYLGHDSDMRIRHGFGAKVRERGLIS